MRHLIIAAAVALSANAYAGCDRDFEQIVGRLAPAASSVAGTDIAPRVLVSAELQDFGYAGLADTANDRLFISPAACAYREVSRIALVAHELGHFAAHALYPALRKDALTGARQIGVALHEAVADDLAAHILASDGSLGDVLSMLKGLCDEHGHRENGIADTRTTSACTRHTTMSAASDNINRRLP